MPLRTVRMMLAVSVVMAACTGGAGTATSTPGADTTILPTSTTTMLTLAPATLTRPYACSFNLSYGNGSSTVRLSIWPSADHDTGLTPGMASVGRVPDGEWGGSVIFGSNLFAFWCQDVIDGPEAVETAKWEIVDGTLDIVSLTPGDRRDCNAHLVASGLVARAADGRLVDVGDFEFFSPAWGAFPGIYGSVFPCGETGGA